MEFESHIQGYTPVLVEFYADECELCQLMIPVLEEVKEWAGDRITILRMNTNNDLPIARDYEVFALPTLILFKHGQVIWRKNGIASAHEILERISLVIA